jgi:hypothetical protein
MNQELRTYINFVTLRADQHDAAGLLKWAPRRLKSAWLSLDSLSWVGEFEDELRESLGIPTSHPIAPWIRSASETFTRALTILYALEKINDDDEWTHKHTLTIHVSLLFCVKCVASHPEPRQIIGAIDTEVRLSRTFEEILHRLPEVNTLKVPRSVVCNASKAHNDIAGAVRSRGARRRQRFRI